MTTERERDRERLLAEARASDWPDLWPSVVGMRARLLESLADVTEAEARQEPVTGAGEAAWSILAVMRHVLAYSRNVLTIIEATARGETVSKDPRGTLAPERGLTLVQLRHALVEESERLATVRQRLPPAPNMDVTVPHAYFGELNCRAWYLFLRIHDADHERQVRGLKSAWRA